MSKTRHLFHLVNLSPWPIATGFSLFYLLSEFVFSINNITCKYDIFVPLTLVILCAYYWFKDIVAEATYQGCHTLVVRKGLFFGFYLFLVSEIMLFFGFFWSFFHSALSPSMEFAGLYPFNAIDFPSYREIPSLNTALLITSGLGVTWAHRGLVRRSFLSTFDGFFFTLLLGFSFIILQLIEYNDTLFTISDSIFSCNFFMLTGLHGLHVFAGISFLTFSLFRISLRHLTSSHHTMLNFAIIYWHFVDVVWIFLFIFVYYWCS